jgi:hypothetical protein
MEQGLQPASGVPTLVTAPEEPPEHLDSGRLAAYLDDLLPPQDRRLVEGHLADCHPCRAELIEVGRLVHEPPRRTAWRALGVTGLAAAAVIAALLFASRSERPDTEDPVFRDGVVQEGTPGFEALSPAPDGDVNPQGLVFRWRSSGPEAFYRFTLTDASGDVVWTGSTQDTEVVLPSTAGLGRGRAYYWYVDALLEDGGSATTGLQRFTTAP